LVTVRRPRASTTPRKSRARRAADRQSRAEARRKNHWHGLGVGCEDGMAGSVRGRGAVWQPPIVPAGPALVYRPPPSRSVVGSRGKYRHWYPLALRAPISSQFFNHFSSRWKLDSLEPLD